MNTICGHTSGTYRCELSPNHYADHRRTFDTPGGDIKRYRWGKGGERFTVFLHADARCAHMSGTYRCTSPIHDDSQPHAYKMPMGNARKGKSKPAAPKPVEAVYSTDYTGQAYAVETLVTDTRSYDVLKSTARTVTVRPRTRTKEIVWVENPGEPFPVNHNATVADPDAPARTLRLRKDGTYRAYQGGHPLRFTDTPPTERTDYRM